MTVPLNTSNNDLIGNQASRMGSNRNFPAQSMSSNDSNGSRGSRKNYEPAANEMKPYENITGYRASRRIDQVLGSQSKVPQSMNINQQQQVREDISAKILSQVQLSKSSKSSSAN